jgi:Lon protease-like protein
MELSSIPLFPLNTVLFPGIPLHLRIFEPRYKEMLSYCVKMDSPFGVVLIRQGQEALGPLASIYPAGCSANIIDIIPQEDGTYFLTAIGKSIFDVIESSTHLPYMTGTIQLRELSTGRSEIKIRNKLQELSHSFRQYLGYLSGINEMENDLAELKLPEDPALLLYTVAHLLQIPAPEKQVILKMETLDELLSLMTRLLSRELALAQPSLEKSSEKFSRKAWLN